MDFGMEILWIPLLVTRHVDESSTTQIEDDRSN